MPLLTAEKHQWTSQPPYNFYHFPEEHRAGWQAFWKEMEGDIDKILDFAKKANIECPNEWIESLHRFLFYTFAGNVKLLKHSADTSFGTFLGKVKDNHTNTPKNKDWYTVRGITLKNFIAMLERAEEIKDVRQAVAFINARVKDLGFYLYSEFLLSKTKGKNEIKSVASDLNKKAYELECNALGISPLNNLKIGSVIKYNLYPNEDFTVLDIIKDNQNKISMVVTKDAKDRIGFMSDLWNVAQDLTQGVPLQEIPEEPANLSTDPAVTTLLQLENYNDFINELERQTQTDPNLLSQKEIIMQQWQQAHPGSYSETI